MAATLDELACALFYDRAQLMSLMGMALAGQRKDQAAVTAAAVHYATATTQAQRWWNQVFGITDTDGTVPVSIVVWSDSRGDLQSEAAKLITYQAAFEADIDALLEITGETQYATELLINFIDAEDEAREAAIVAGDWPDEGSIL